MKSGPPGDLHELLQIAQSIRVAQKAREEATNEALLSIRRYIFRYLSRNRSLSDEIAENLVQETLLRLVKLIRERRLPVKSDKHARSFAINTANWIVADFFRAQKRARLESPLENIAEIAISPSPNSDDFLERKEERAQLYSLIQELRPSYREVLLLIIKGFSHQEIAEHMDISKGTVKDYKKSAKKQLLSNYRKRQILAGEE